MKLDSLFSNLRVLWRADKIIADIRLRHLLARSAINAVAIAIAVFGLLFLEVAAYFALLQKTTAIASAAMLGGFNLAVAALLMIVAARRKPDRELALVRDVHKNAVEAIQLDLQVLQDYVSRGPRFETILPALIPLTGFLLRSLKKAKAPPQGAGS
jgi:hypothetical protein